MSADAKFNVLHELEGKQRQFNDALIASLQISLNADVTQPDRDDPMMAMFRGARPTFQMATPGLAFPVAVRTSTSPEAPELQSRVRDDGSHVGQ